MKIHLVDGTYELFRSHFGAPPRLDAEGREVGATVGLLRSLLAAALHAGRDPRGLRLRPRHRVVSQRPVRRLQDERRRRRAICWHSSRSPRRPSRRWAWWSGRWWSSRPTTRWPQQPRVYASRPASSRSCICSPDKDLAQCVVGERVVCWDRRRDIVLDEAGVIDEVRRPAGVHPRLAGARRRFGGRLSRHPRLGRQVGRRRSGQVRAPRGHPGRPGRARSAWGAGDPPRGEPPGGPRRRAAVSPSGDVAARRAHRRGRA